MSERSELHDTGSELTGQAAPTARSPAGPRGGPGAHSTGQELPAHMHQHKRSLGLIYAVNPFGADHQSSEHDSALRANPGSLPHRRLGEI